MSILNLPNHRAIPTLNEPAQVVGITVLVSVQCRQCDSPDLIGLINGQKAVCETCGAVLNLDALSWRNGDPHPQVALSAAPSRAKQLLSS